MSEQSNYEERLPRQPSEGALEWCIREKFTKEYLIYRNAWWTEPLTGMKEECVRVSCTACGGSWLAQKVRDAACCQCGTPFGFLDEKTKKVCGGMAHMRCQECGAAVEVKHIGQISRYGIEDNVFFCEPWQLGNKFVLLGWRCERNIGKDAEKVYRIWPYEAYVFEERKAVRLSGYQKCMTAMRFFDKWRQLKRCDDKWGRTGLADWLREPEIAGTNVENSALPQYLKAAGSTARPVTYLRLWQRHKNIENLVVQGCGGMVADAIDREADGYYNKGLPGLSWIDWKQKRPARMLGLNKEEFALFIREKWGRDDLAKYKMVRAYDKKLKLPEDWEAIRKKTIYALEKLCRETYMAPSVIGGHTAETLRGRLSIMRCLRYLDKQKSEIITLLDYWRMANRAGLDIRDEHIQLPKNLKHEHDRLAEAERIAKNEEEKRRKQAEIEKRRPAFEKAVAPLEAWSWEDGGICIRPVHTEQELVDEGSALHHCVGGYGPKVAKGESCIFFIRRADAPEKPWFTLQVELATLKEIQNHGLRNCGPTKEVQEFVNRWLEHVRKLRTAGNKNRKEHAA